MTARIDHVQVRLVLVVPFILIALGCDEIHPQFRNPISDPATAQPDARLCGRWKQQRSDGIDNFLVIDQSHTRDHPAGMMSAVLSGNANTGYENRFLFFVVSVLNGGDAYMNWFERQEFPAGQKLEDPDCHRLWMGNPERSFCIEKYRVVGDNLEAWSADPVELAHVIDRGLLQGRVARTQDGKLSSCIITDNSATLARFFGGSNSNVVFADTARLKSVYARVGRN